jgi:hypothetical protein
MKVASGAGKILPPFLPSVTKFASCHFLCVKRCWVWAGTTGSSKTGAITNGNTGQDCISG